MPINEPTPPPVSIDQDTFGVLVLGVGEMFSSRFYHTSLLVVAGDRLIQVDTPCPYFKILAEATEKAGLPITPDDIDDYIVTHVHGDHCNGCEAIGFHKRFIQNRRPRLYAIPEVMGPLWEGRLSASMGQLTDADLNPLPPATLESFFDTRLLSTEEPTTIGDMTVSFRRTLHAVPCVAVKCERDGRRIGYSCDTLYDPSLIEWLSDCDLIFHESTLGPHTPIDKLAALDDSLRARMAVIHLHDQFECEDALLRVAQQGGFYQVP